MNKRYLTAVPAVAGLGFILWFPIGTISNLIGYALIALSILIQWITFRKAQKNKK